MRLGLHLPQIGAPGAREIADVARRAEGAGYASLWVSDHLVVPAAGGAIPPIEMLDPLTTLAFAAAATERIRIATSVLVLPYRHPIHLAKQLASLDLLSGGRLVIGAASGWLEEEFRALGAPYEKRGAYTDEAIRLMRTLWANENPEFRGEFFSLSGMSFGPRPAAGKIPIWVGGTSRRAIRRAVELGDGWHATRLRPEGVAERVSWLRKIAATSGRTLAGFTVSHRVYVGFASTWTETGGYVDGVLAPPEALGEYLSRFADAGVEELMLTPLPPNDVQGFVERFEREVRPRLPASVD